MIILTIQEDSDKLRVLEELKNWLEDGIELCSPQWGAFRLALELEALDYGLEPLDVLHIATAIEKGASRFVTLEGSILKKERFIEEVRAKYGLKIVSP